MFKFSGDIEYRCNECGDRSNIAVDDFSIECVGSYERQMGCENHYEIEYEFDCPECNNSISLKFEAWEYPVEVLNLVENKTTGAETESEPSIEYLREIYTAEDLFQFYESIPELITALKCNPYLLRELTSREFEEVVAEIFRSSGFHVDLTKRTRDGGKDIIAVHTDKLGIKTKYFIECKRYAEDNKIGVEVVRALQGVKNTKDGPNKTIIATTSSFTSDARRFVANEATSSWDMTLADYNDIVRWLDSYSPS
jgi:restriction endonuclease Mrr